LISKDNYIHLPLLLEEEGKEDDCLWKLFSSFNYRRHDSLLSLSYRLDDGYQMKEN